ncbi:MAG: YkgJ family cysteine cluster protein, partial [Planctomycetes bacterium]|nr:YkgJ family cysteine cluster protein [Planctomycetota bacterium]
LLPGGSCPWFVREDGLGGCRIYEARPEHCRTFPYWPEILEDDAAFAEARRFCAGIEVSGIEVSGIEVSGTEV